MDVRETDGVMRIFGAALKSLLGLPLAGRRGAVAAVVAVCGETSGRVASVHLRAQDGRVSPSCVVGCSCGRDEGWACKGELGRRTHDSCAEELLASLRDLLQLAGRGRARDVCAMASPESGRDTSWSWSERKRERG